MMSKLAVAAWFGTAVAAAAQSAPPVTAEAFETYLRDQLNPLTVDVSGLSRDLSFHFIPVEGAPVTLSYVDLVSSIKSARNGTSAFEITQFEILSLMETGPIVTVVYDYEVAVMRKDGSAYVATSTNSEIYERQEPLPILTFGIQTDHAVAPLSVVAEPETRPAGPPPA